MDQWSAVYRAFSVETFLRNNSARARQRICRRHFNPGRHGTVHDGNTVKNLVQKFRTTSSATNMNPRDGVTTVGTPGNNDRVWSAIGRSSKWSAGRHSATRNMSSRWLRRLPDSDLHYQPYKLNTMQELSDCDFYIRSVFCEQFVTLVKEHPDLSLFTVVPCILMSSKYFIYQLMHNRVALKEY